MQHFHSASPYEGSIGFSRAVRVGSRIIVSGTAPIDSSGDALVGDAGVQAQRCFDIAVHAIEGLGGRRADVCRTRMYLVDPADWSLVAAAHAEWFEDVAPAATMVVVAGLLDPSWRVEIEVEAWVPSGSTEDA